MAGRFVYRFADVELDVSGGCLRRQGHPEQYPRSKVFRVLVYLLEHRDRVITKNELVEHLWNGSAITDDAVFHCISDIRTLLGDSRESARFVRTFPAEGYRFVAAVEAIPVPEESLPAPPDAARQRYRVSRWIPWVAGIGLLSAAAIALTVRHQMRIAEPALAEAAWWRIDEGTGTAVRDVSGGRNDGALVGQPGWIDGRLGKAIQMEGVNSHIAGKHDATVLPRGSSPRTVVAWIRTVSTNGDRTCVLEYGGGRPATFRLSLTDSGHIAAGHQHEEIQGVSRLDDGHWHFVAATYEGVATNMVRLYVDGRQDGAGKLRVPLDTGPGMAWRIGRHLENSTPFRGAIDDVRVYSRALSPPAMMALYRCGAAQSDVALSGGRKFYYLPVFPATAIVSGSGGEMQNAGNDLGGVQFARSDGVCSFGSLRGAAVGQDLQMSVEVLTPPQPDGAVTTAGPYFRSRAAAPGDGIIGGTSAGYWVQLYSTGVVKVRRLNPHQIVAFTATPAHFDATLFHRLVATVQRTELHVTLDGTPLEFDQGGRKATSVSIPAAWDGVPPIGFNQGTAGVTFSSEPRGSATGQRVRDLRITVLATAPPAT